MNLTFEIPKALVLSSNDRLHWAAKMKRTKTIRALAATTARGRGCVTAPVEITCTVQYARAGRHDAHNLQPTAKALIDGLVDAGVIADDDDQHVAAVTFRAATGKGKPGHTTIHVALKETT